MHVKQNKTKTEFKKYSYFFSQCYIHPLNLIALWFQHLLQIENTVIIILRSIYNDKSSRCPFLGITCIFIQQLLF